MLQAAVEASVAENGNDSTNSFDAAMLEKQLSAKKDLLAAFCAIDTNSVGFVEFKTGQSLDDLIGICPGLKAYQSHVAALNTFAGADGKFDYVAFVEWIVKIESSTATATALQPTPPAGPRQRAPRPGNSGDFRKSVEANRNHH